MSGERNLPTLLAHMSPVCDPERYVFATTTQTESTAHLDAIMRFKESEGETLIVKEADADRSGLKRSDLYARITLNIHSALDAVGFLAAICSALAKEGISSNAVAAFHHDHVFVPFERAEDAMLALKKLSDTTKETLDCLTR